MIMITWLSGARGTDRVWGQQYSAVDALAIAVVGGSRAGGL